MRVRQHVNPFSLKYQQPIAIPEWEKIYDKLNQPLHLDIGCARGKFLLEMAKFQPEINFLGIEIREPLVIAANREKEELDLKNLYYLFANINNSLESLLQSLPDDSLHWVTIQFPDPWFKKKHNKRRVVQPQLVDTLAQYLVDDGIVFLQSDVETVAKEMGDRFLAHPAFKQQHQETWLAANPLPVQTERELYTLSHGQPVYRLLLQKTAYRNPKY